jgi:hypothetical protein
VRKTKCREAVAQIHLAVLVNAARERAVKTTSDESELGFWVGQSRKVAGVRFENAVLHFQTKV